MLRLRLIACLEWFLWSLCQYLTVGYESSAVTEAYSATFGLSSVEL